MESIHTFKGRLCRWEVIILEDRAKGNMAEVSEVSWGGIEASCSWILFVQEVRAIKVVLQKKIDSEQNRKECCLLYA